MEILFKKRNGDPIDNRYAVPVPTSLKKKIEEIKNTKGVDVNEMLRQVMQDIVAKLEQSA